MNNILIKNGMVVSPNGVKKQDVLLRDGKVAALGDAAVRPVATDMALAGCLPVTFRETWKSVPT